MKDSRLVSSIHLNLEGAVFMFLIRYSAAQQKGKIKHEDKIFLILSLVLQPHRCSCVSVMAVI